MGDKSILSKKNLTKDDICSYMLSDCSYNNTPENKISTYDAEIGDTSYFDENEEIAFLEERLAAKQAEDEYFDDLQRAQQEEWDARQEYEAKLADIQDRYPNFDAKEAAFWGEDPEEAERKARIDDYLNNWY